MARQGTVHITEGLVDQIEVDVVELQAFQRLIDRLERTLLAGVFDVAGKLLGMAGSPAGGSGG